MTSRTDVRGLARRARSSGATKAQRGHDGRAGEHPSWSSGKAAVRLDGGVGKRATEPPGATSQYRTLGRALD